MTDFNAARAGLVEQSLAGIKDESVLAAIGRVPRERFVPPEMSALDYKDRPLPIGWEQTISQAFLVFESDRLRKIIK